MKLILSLWLFDGINKRGFTSRNISILTSRTPLNINININI